jgi:transposase
MSDTSATKKAAIVALKEQKISNRAIANKENVSPSTVSRINKRYGANRQFDSKSPRTGSPTKITERDAQRATRMLSSGQARNVSDLKRKLFPYLHVNPVKSPKGPQKTWP